MTRLTATAVANYQQIVVFRLGNQEFALEIGLVKEIIRLVEITPLPRVPEAVAGMINVRGKIIPVVDLHKHLQLQRISAGAAARIVLVDAGAALVGLWVDEAVDVLRVDPDELKSATDIMTGDNLVSIKGVFNLNERLISLLNIVDVLNITAGLDLSK